MASYGSGREGWLRKCDQWSGDVTVDVGEVDEVDDRCGYMWTGVWMMWMTGVDRCMDEVDDRCGQVGEVMCVDRCGQVWGGRGVDSVPK